MIDIRPGDGGRRRGRSPASSRDLAGGVRRTSCLPELLDALDVERDGRRSGTGPLDEPEFDLVVAADDEVRGFVSLGPSATSG